LHETTPYKPGNPMSMGLLPTATVTLDKSYSRPAMEL
jgi:hypothetical protein